MLFDKGNPYRGGLPKRIKLTEEDFIYDISSINLYAIEKPAAWTILLYMAGDCNLAEFMFDDILEIKDVGSNEDINICVFFDGPLLTDSFFARLNKNTKFKEDIIFRFLDVYSYDFKVLTEIITNTSILYPSKYKMLILSGHGLGWQGALRDDTTWKTYKKRNAIIFPGPDRDIYIGQLNDCYKKTLAKVKSRIDPESVYRGRPFDIIALDACNMGNVETLGLLYPHSNILVASENQVPASGYPYKKILKNLLMDPSQTPQDIAITLVKETKTYYKNMESIYEDVEVTQAAFNCHNFPKLFKRIGKLAHEMTRYLLRGGENIIKYCIENTWEEGGIYKDLKGLCLNLLEENIPIYLRKATQALINFLNDREFVIASTALGERYSPNEISVYCPPHQEFDGAYIPVVKDLPDHFRHWYIFLIKYYEMTS